MKKSLVLLLILVLLAAVCGVSCGESLTEKIAGTWYENEEIVGGRLSETSRTGYTFAFNEDGTGQVTGQNTSGDTQDAEIKWQEEKNGITIELEINEKQYRYRLLPYKDMVLFNRGNYISILGKKLGEKSGIRYGSFAEYSCEPLEGMDEITDELLDTTVSILKTRMEQKGYEDANVERLGEDRIRIEIEGKQDDEAFTLADAQGNMEFLDPEGKVFMGREGIASVEYDNGMGSFNLLFTLTDEGRKIFAEETEKDVGKMISIRMDDEILVQATVSSAIPYGNVVLHNNTWERAKGMIAVLNTPVLPVKLSIVGNGSYSDVEFAEHEEDVGPVGDITVVLKMGDREMTQYELNQAIQKETEYAKAYAGMMNNAYMYPVGIQEQVIADIKKEWTLDAKVKELHLDQLTEEDMETVRREAQAYYDSILDYAKVYVKTDGLDEEGIDQAARDMMLEYGYTLESVTEEQTGKLINKKLRDYIINDVTVTDEEIRAERDKRAEAGRTGDELEESLIKETLLSAKQDKVYQETVEEWIQNAGIIDKLQTAENKTNLSLLDLVDIMTENK